MRGWILFDREMDPALPEVPEVLRFQRAAASMEMELHVLNPHNFDLFVGAGDDWSVTYQDQLMDRPDFIICRAGAETAYLH